MTSQHPLRILVPMKPAYEGKTRLAGVLDADGRAALSLHLLQHVLSVASRVASAETWVIGGDAWVKHVATLESALWQPDAGGGLNEALRPAIRVAFEAGAPAILVLPGDLGLLTPGDVNDLVRLANGFQKAVVSRAAADGGTNALLVPRGLALGPFFGPGSFQRHMQEAQKAKVPVEICHAAGLAFDLDTPHDLLAYRAARPELESALTSWREKLRSQTPELTGYWKGESRGAKPRWRGSGGAPQI
ncbi:MAG: 2-phospho-L-lactate guanylyltransferase [Dehalococcoidia bacterium]|nr:2-phospho-L-lactate guanylyltransferase [Dehalococcoidia bacterium]